MTQFFLFTSFSILTLTSLIVFASLHKKVGFKSVLGLFVFGILISIPFAIIEQFGIHANYIYVIAAFIFIELGILFFEHHVNYFHKLIHHNIKELRIASFILIGLGFTYSEVGLTILHSSGDMVELINTIPFKTTYAILMHTVFASAASLVQVGNLMSKGIIATIIKSATYYIRIAIISISHFLYIFSIEHNLMLLIGILLIVGISVFFYIKHKFDLKLEEI